MMARVGLASERFFEGLAEAAEATGTDDFYAVLSAQVAKLLGCKRWLVMRYARYAAPEFIVNEAMSKSAVQSYLNGLYRLDPLLRLVRSGTRSGVFVLNKLRHGDENSTYFDRLFQMSMIYDEAALMLSVPGAGSIAICVERATQHFTEQDTRALGTVFPLIKALHTVHLDRMFQLTSQGVRTGHHERTQRAILVLDKHNRTVLRNENWAAMERAKQAPDLSDVYESHGAGMRKVEPDSVLHWEKLADTFAIAPSGRICIVETHSPGYITADFGESLAQFQHLYALTPRERDIVNLVLQGYPNSEIARALKIAVGTIRNHRYRLYNKLDITSERELFFLFIDCLLGRHPPLHTSTGYGSREPGQS